MAGWLVLNTDASKPEASGDAAIGAILRQKPRPTAPMKVVAYISEVVGPLEIQEAEYHALIEGRSWPCGTIPMIFKCSPTQRSSPTRSASKGRG